MFAACPVPSVPALAAPRRPKRRSRCPFGNSCSDIRRQKLVLRRPNSVLCRTSSHPRSSFYPSCSPKALPPLKPERLLCRPCRLDVNALQREHADLGRRAAWRGKTTNLTPCRQDSVAGDHQRHGVLRHGLADIARGFRSGAELLRQGPIGRCAAPSDLSSRGVDALKEWILLAEVELEHGKIRLIAFEIAPYSGNRLGHLRRGRAGFCAGQLAQQNSFGRCGALCRQLEARDAHAVPGDPAKAARGFENKIMVCPAHHMALAFSICYGARRTQAGIQPGSCFLIWRAKNLSRRGRKNQLTDVGSRPITAKRCLQRLWMQSRRKRARWQRMQNEAHDPA